MAKSKKPNPRPKKKRSKPKTGKLRKYLQLFARYTAKAFWWIVGFQAVIVFLFAFINPPTNFYMLSESLRLDGVKQQNVEIENVSSHVARAIVAAEDANFCQHWGFDLGAIRSVVTSGSGRLRGASTLSQQVAKNVFLWPSRSWLRKALEAETTILIELFWSKRRIVEVYMNIAEFDEGVFGIAAAGPHYFGIKHSDLSLLQSSRLAAVLPSPKKRSASNPSQSVRKRTGAIMDGARTILADGRSSCFE